MILSDSDGQHTMLEIAEKCNCTLADLVPVIEQLEKVGLLTPKARFPRTDP